MKTKMLLITSLLGAALLAGPSALAAGPRGGNRGPAPSAPVRNNSGSATTYRGNPNSTGTPVRDGSGKATAPGKGAKDGTGNQANCPNTPEG